MKNLTTLRENSGLTKVALAKELGIADATLSFYESGKRQPDIEMLKKIALYFDTTIDYLVDYKTIRKNYMPTDIKNVSEAIAFLKSINISDIINERTDNQIVKLAQVLLFVLSK